MRFSPYFHVKNALHRGVSFFDMKTSNCTLRSSVSFLWHAVDKGQLENGLKALQGFESVSRRRPLGRLTPLLLSGVLAGCCWEVLIARQDSDNSFSTATSSKKPDPHAGKLFSWVFSVHSSFKEQSEGVKNWFWVHLGRVFRCCRDLRVNPIRGTRCVYNKSTDLGLSLFRFFFASVLHSSWRWWQPWIARLFLAIILTSPLEDHFLSPSTLVLCRT